MPDACYEVDGMFRVLAREGGMSRLEIAFLTLLTVLAFAAAWLYLENTCIGGVVAGNQEVTERMCRRIGSIGPLPGIGQR